MSALPPLDGLVAPLRVLVKQAAEAILAVYGSAFAVTTKADNSPVTEADLASDRLIRAGLAVLTPDIPVITEETFDGNFTLQPGRPFWLVDPLDGTREFVARSGEFTVNIGLIGEGGLPVLGIMLAPVFGRCLWGIVGQGAWTTDGDGPVRPITTRPLPEEGATVVNSRYHGDKARLNEFLKDYTVASRQDCGSTWKFCKVASGEADLYPHFGHTYEWDSAAGHAVLLAAGGNIHTLDGGLLTYGKPGLRNPPYIAKGREF